MNAYPSRESLISKLRGIVANQQAINTSVLAARDRLTLEGEEVGDIEAGLLPDIDGDVSPQMGLGVEPPTPTAG